MVFELMRVKLTPMVSAKGTAWSGSEEFTPYPDRLPPLFVQLLNG